MSRKLKIVLGLLLVLAGFLVLRIGLYFKSSTNSAVSALVKGVSNSIDSDYDTTFIDNDQDGILDKDEAYYQTDPFNPDTDGDGYFDGEEIASGYNPTKKEEKKVSVESNRYNVTEGLTKRLIGGMNAGEIDPSKGSSQIFSQNVDLLTLAALDEAVAKIGQSTKQTSNILLTDNSKESQEEYLKNISKILEGPFLSAFIEQPQAINQALTSSITGDFEQSVSIFKNYNIRFTEAYTGLLTIPAPENFAEFHKKLLNFFQRIATEYNYATQIEKDPITSLTAIANMTRFLGTLDISIIQDLRMIIDSNDLVVPNSSLFRVLDLLNTE